MPAYLLKTALGGPELYYENTYSESIAIRHGYAITESELTCNELQVGLLFHVVRVLETRAQAEALLARALELGYLPEDDGEPTLAGGFLTPEVMITPVVDPPPPPPQKNVPWYGADVKIGPHAARE